MNFGTKAQLIRPQATPGRTADIYAEVMTSTRITVRADQMDC